jgi:ubiquitin C-terminal hydrolase
MLEFSEINDYKCSNCLKTVDLLKRSVIGETPNVLFVHLQRILLNYDTFESEKINSKFDFPSILDLRPYSLKANLQETIQKKGDTELIEMMNLDDDSFIYKLVGVTIHTGTAQHGHYYSLINKNRGEKECDPKLEKWSNVEKDDWLKFDDDEVSTYLFSGMAGEAFGGDGTSLSNDEVTKLLAADKGYGKSAYMLVYECKKKKDVR